MISPSPLVVDDIRSEVSTTQIRRRMIELIDDHPSVKGCPICNPAPSTLRRSAYWSKEMPIIRFTSKGLEVTHYGESR